MIFNKEKNISFLKLIGSSFLIQGLVQFIGMLIGFYVVRQLSIQEYAYYTTANIALGIMVIVSNCGITSSILSQGAKVWQNPEKLGAVINTGIRFRKRFSFFTIIISIPILVYMLFKQGADEWTIILISIMTVFAFQASLTDSIYEIVLKLHNSLRSLQFNQFLVSILRLFLLGIVLIFSPFAWVAMFANSIPRIYGNFKLKRIVKKNADLSQHEDLLVKRETIRIVKRAAPGMIYYAFSGQITFFFLAYMGEVENTASWGALSRFAVVFTILSTTISLVLIPKYAKLHENRIEIFRLSHRIIAISLLSGTVILFLVFNFSEILLKILGSNYKNLNTELMLIMLNSFFVFLTGLVVNFSNSRGWIFHPIIDLLISILPVVIFVLIIPMNSLYNVALFGVGCSALTLVASYVVFRIQIINKCKE